MTEIKTPARVEAAIRQQAKAVTKLRENEREVALHQIELQEVEQRLAMLQSAAAPVEAQAWCVDLTEDGQGEVATLEVPGEPALVLIAPGCRAPTAGDGRVEARATQDPNQVFLNAAILPGWQKWRPTYRTGVIVSVDAVSDTATVTLEPARSSAQGLDVNQATTLVNVPVEYMACNASVFEPDDRCVVQFVGQNWGSPKVIGFAQWPRECSPFELYFAYGDTPFDSVTLRNVPYANFKIKYIGDSLLPADIVANYESYVFEYCVDGLNWGQYSVNPDRFVDPFSISLGFGPRESRDSYAYVERAYPDGKGEIQFSSYKFKDIASSVYAFRIRRLSGGVVFRFAFRITDALFNGDLAHVAGVSSIALLPESMPVEVFSFDFPR